MSSTQFLRRQGCPSLELPTGSSRLTDFTSHHHTLCDGLSRGVAVFVPSMFLWVTPQHTHQSAYKKLYPQASASGYNKIIITLIAFVGIVFFGSLWAPYLEYIAVCSHPPQEIFDLYVITRVLVTRHWTSISLPPMWVSRDHFTW